MLITVVGTPHLSPTQKNWVVLLYKCFGVPNQRRSSSRKRKDTLKWKRGILKLIKAILEGSWWGQALLLDLHESFLSEHGHQKLPLPAKCFFIIPGPWKQFYYIIRIQGALGLPICTFAGQHHVKKGIVKEWWVWGTPIVSAGWTARERWFMQVLE